MKKIISLLMIFAMVFAFAACGSKDEAETTAAKNADAQTTVNGEDAVSNEALVETIEPKGTVIGSYDPGETGFYVKIINKAGETFDYTIYTDQTKLGPALLSKSFIDGEETDNGFVLKTVNGETHNYETEGYAWRVYVGEELTDKTVDTINLENGATYTFKVETY